MGILNIDEHVEEAQQADLFMLRNLLARAYNALQNVAIEARTSWCANAAIEALMLDILTVLDKRTGVQNAA